MDLLTYPFGTGDLACLLQKARIQVDAVPAHAVSQGCVVDDASVTAPEVQDDVTCRVDGAGEEGKEGLRGSCGGGGVGRDLLGQGVRLVTERHP